MKLQDAREAYESLSGKASEIVRQLSLAGVALIWVFKSGASGTSTPLLLDRGLLKAAVFIFLALLFDFLQYLVGTTIWFRFYRYKEKKGTEASTEFLAPSKLTWPTWGLFYVKSAMMVLAYIGYIIPFLISKLGA